MLNLKSKTMKKANGNSRSAKIANLMNDEKTNFETSSPKKRGRKPGSKNMRKRSDNRQVLVLMDEDNGKVDGVFLDAGHAAKVLNLKVKEIKSDLIKGTKNTGLWFKIPAGATLDQKEIERNAKFAYKEWKATGGVIQKGKPGRKAIPVDREEIAAMLKKLDLSQYEDSDIKKIRAILNKTAKKEKSNA